MIQHKKLITKLDTIVDQDWEKILKWRNSPEIYKWSRQNDLLREVPHKEWIHSHQKNPNLKMYKILDRENESIGVCGLTDIDLINQNAQFSIYINPSSHKSGYGTDALKLLIWHSFNAYPFRTIWGETFDGNPAIKCFEKVGFKLDGIRRDFYFRDGNFIDSKLISIKREEFVI